MSTCPVYTYNRNACNCHPETCACDPWVVFDTAGKRMATCYHESQAKRLTQRLNNDAGQTTEDQL